MNGELPENKLETFLKKYPPWFMLEVHPIRHAKKTSEEEEKIEKEMNELMSDETKT